MSRKNPPKSCETCFAEFSPRGEQRFCSKPCSAAYFSKLAREKAGATLTTKICKRCEEPKSITDDFSPHKLGLGGTRSICKQCSSREAIERHQTPEGAEVHRRAQRAYARTSKGAAKKLENTRSYHEGDPRPLMLRRARRRAEEKGYPFSITEEDVIVPETCPVFGTPLKAARGEFHKNRFGGKANSPSIDKIIPSLGYVPGNVRVISWRANRLKNDASLEELEALVRWLRSLLSEG